MNTPKKPVCIFDGDESYYYDGENPPSIGFILSVDDGFAIVSSVEEKEDEFVVVLENLDDGVNATSFDCSEYLPFPNGMFSLHNNIYTDALDLFKSALRVAVMDCYSQEREDNNDWKDGLDAMEFPEELFDKAVKLVKKRMGEVYY
jgi:hypothetical protein